MSEIERYLDELFDRMAGQGAAGRRALAEAEDHLRASAADAMARAVPADQAELDAIARFGSPAVVARKMRSALGGGLVSRAVSVGWLLAGLATAGLGVAYLAAYARLGWLSPAWMCTNFLNPSCYSSGDLIRDMQGAVIAASVGTALLFGRWLAVRYGRLAPVRRGFASAAGLVIGLVAFSFGMTGQVPALPGSVTGGLFWVPLRHGSFFLGAAALMECVAAAVSLAGSRPRWHLR